MGGRYSAARSSARHTRGSASPARISRRSGGYTARSPESQRRTVEPSTSRSRANALWFPAVAAATAARTSGAGREEDRSLADLLEGAAASIRIHCSHNGSLGPIYEEEARACESAAARLAEVEREVVSRATFEEACRCAQNLNGQLWRADERTKRLEDQLSESQSQAARAGEALGDEKTKGVVAALSWSLDLLDQYDERLAKLDGRERVYSDVHRLAKAKARAALAEALIFLASLRPLVPPQTPDGAE